MKECRPTTSRTPAVGLGLSRCGDQLGTTGLGQRNVKMGGWNDSAASLISPFSQRQSTAS